MPRRLLVTIVLLSVLAVIFACSCGPTGGVVNFPDPNLEAAVREKIHKPTGDIYRSDLERYTKRLSLLESGITDLTGLDYFINVKELRLVRNQISDLTPISNLTNLTYLDISYNPISDLSPLSNLTNIECLYTKYCNIADISPLGNLTKLERFHAHNNKISNISVLTNLTNLNELQLDFNQISDISPLVENTGIGSGDFVTLYENPLSEEAINVYIPQLLQRGVNM